MDIKSPDLLHASEGQFKRQTSVIATVFALFVIGASAFGARWSYLSNQAIATGASAAPRIPVISSLRQFIFGDDVSASTSTHGRVGDRMNILVLGIGGVGHDGANLSDTILIASIDLKEKKVGLVSVPRDLAYPLGSGKFEKINAVNAYAEQDNPGQGAIKTAQAFSDLFNIPIDHVVRIDFAGFEKLIDALGGVTINVENSFTDNSYPMPDPSTAWETVSFKKGVQQMDGATALIYARSRHGNNGEGSDFARSRRQQIVIEAVREKALSLGTLADPGKLADIYQVLSQHIQTDLSVWDILKFAPLANAFSKENVTTHVMTDGPNGILTAANVDGSYMLFPKNPDWSDIRALVQDPFASTTTQQVAVSKPQETIRLEVKNGTFRTNFAAEVAGKLVEDGYEITALGNAAKRGFDRTSIYDLTGGKKPAELARLQHLMNADVVSISPDQLVSAANGAYRTFPVDKTTQERVYSQNTDFVLILGEASFALVKAQ